MDSLTYFKNTNPQENALFKTLKARFTVTDNTLLYIGQLLRRAAYKFGNDEAIIDAQRSVTYKQLYGQAVAMSNHLKKLGIKKDDRVVLYRQNSIQFYISYFAILQVGAVLVPVSSFLHIKELSHIINDCMPEAIIVSSVLQKNIEQAIAENLLTATPHIVNDDSILDLSKSYEQLKTETENFIITHREQDELSALLYTSGTTGTPKSVMLSSRNIITNAMQVCARLQLIQSTKERFLCVLPLFHVFAQNACLWMPIMMGSSIVLVEGIDRGKIIQGLKKKPTIFIGVPALYGLLCSMKNAPLESVKLFVSGADAMPDKIRSAFCLLYGRKIATGYGLTEASPVIAVNIKNDEQQTHVIGEPLVGIDCDIRNDKGVSLSKDSIGVLWVRADNVMMGYYKDLAMTNEIIQSGWLNTGDLASVDEHGILAICGRSKDLIIHKGLNIYPQEVENVLLKHPAVFKAAVIGQSESASGQIAVAYVAVKEGKKEVEKKLLSLCRHNLAAYKVPRKFFCVDDLPMNATGKVDKKLLTFPLT